MKKEKILFFIFDLGYGGAEKVLTNLIKELDPGKYDITVQTLFDYGVNKKYLPNYIKYKTFFKRPPFRGISYIQRLFSPRFLYKLIIKENYDIVIAYLENSTTRIISGCTSKETNKFAWVHNEKISKKSYQNYKEFKESYESFDKIAFVSEYAKEIFKQNYNDINIKGEVVNNTLDVPQIIKRGEEKVDFELNRQVVNFCSIGRLTHQKGYLRLLEVLNDLKKSNIKNWHFYLIGEGEQKLQIKNLIQKYNLENNITMLGFQDNPHKYLSKMDCFVCSSYYEGYSTAVTESVILKVPVLTTKC